MSALKFATWWFRYVLALIVTTALLLISLVPAVFMKLGDLAESVLDGIARLDVFPAPRGIACKACNGRGRMPTPRKWDENDTPAAARRRGAGVTP